MTNEFFDRGATKVCPTCHRAFYIPAPALYAYKMETKVNGVSTLLYFCRYSHKRQYENEREKKRSQRFQDKSDRLIRERVSSRGRPPEAYDYEDKNCEDCRYCIRGKFGFTDCTVYSRAINPGKAACRRYRPKDGGVK